jgi:hypothetical protein
MHLAIKTGIIVLSLSAVPLATEAGTLEGAGIGAGIGAVVLGPVGAVGGAAIGYVVGGPNIVTRSHYRRCWHDYRGNRHCVWR